MRNYMNPSSIERMDPVWDFQLMSALLHMRGAGQDVPDPEVRLWFFRNGYGAQAVTSRDFLMIGMLYYDVSAGLVHEGEFCPLNEQAIRDFGLPSEVFSPRERLTVEEVEAYLGGIKAFQSKSEVTVQRKE